MHEVRRASRAVWDAMARGWDERHQYFEEIARPVTELMLERAAPAPGEAVVDLAAGTGVVGFAAATTVGPDGHVIVSDFAPSMVEVAARQAEVLGLGNVECRVLDAEHLDLPDASADVVLCRWGYMLMPDPAAALAESRRVLRPGGRLSFAVFSGPERNPWAAVPMGVLRERDLVPPPQPGAPGILALADHERLRDLLAGAGLADPRIETVPFSFRFGDADDFWRFLTDAAGAIAVTLERLDDEQRALVRGDLAARLGPFESAGGIDLPAESIVVSARPA